LAQYTHWGPLYDLDQLAKNSVPVAALVYTDDVFVERNLSFASAQQVNNLQIWESDAWHHDGIGEAGAEIFRHLHDMINRSSLTCKLLLLGVCLVVIGCFAIGVR